MTMLLLAALHLSPVGSDLNLPDPCTHATLANGARVTFCGGRRSSVTHGDVTRIYRADGSISVRDVQADGSVRTMEIR